MARYRTVPPMPHRHDNCHSSCERYAEYRKPFDAAAEKRLRDAAVECAMNYINSSNHKRLRRLAARSKGSEDEKSSCFGLPLCTSFHSGGLVRRSPAHTPGRAARRPQVANPAPGTERRFLS